MNVDITVIGMVIPVILAARPVAKLLNVNPSETIKASLIFILFELSKSDFSAESIISVIFFKARSFALEFFISFNILWIKKYAPNKIIIIAPRMLGIDDGKNFDINLPIDMDNRVPIDVTVAMTILGVYK